MTWASKPVPNPSSMVCETELRMEASHDLSTVVELTS